MKHNLKRILPILLAIAVICSMIWYLFIYDRDFTRDMLIGSARFFEQRGNHAVASWFYDQAYSQSGGNDKVAIELAERYIAIGDYTKAEQTLRKAIETNATVELYMAQSKTYVAQNKLKDAVSTLDNITNEELKAQLDALRPAVPTASAQSGYYKQYISVTVECESGTLYMTADGSYPSTSTPAANNTVTLPGGESIIQAIAVNSNGLVSPLAHFSYVVKDVIEEVTLSDSSVDTLVREKLQIGADKKLFTDNLWSITDFTFPKDAEISEDLALLTGLTKLTAENSTVDGWSSLASLTELTELTMKGCLLSAEDLAAIASLPKLEKLTLSGCNLSTIQNLAEAKHLKQLDLSNNTIRDISAISSMAELTQLNLNHNALEDVTALGALEKLTTLDISYNSLASIAPLSGCKALTDLNIRSNKLTALTGVEAMKSLAKLDASFNAFTDVSALGVCTALKELDISNNQLSDIAALSALKSLQYLNFSRNQVKTLPDFGKTSALVTIDGSYNAVTSVSALAGYENLNNVVMDYNKISNVNVLSACGKLISVSVYGNPVSDVSELAKMDVIVSFTPKT